MIPMDVRHYSAFAQIAEAEAGLYMPAAKQAFVASRLQRRLRMTGLQDFGLYLHLVREQTPEGRAERLQFIAALTTNVTSVFREPHHFAILAAHLGAHETDASNSKYRIWSAGCATGEEPLSIAATCRAVLGSDWHRKVKILATDVDETVIARARNPIDVAVLGEALSDLPDGIPTTGRRRAGTAEKLFAELQIGIEYRQHNLLDPLIGYDNFDAIFCRNVTIYFSRPAQEAVHAMLRSRLAPGGLLAIGHSERLLGALPPMSPAGRTAFVRTDDAICPCDKTGAAPSWP